MKNKFVMLFISLSLVLNCGLVVNAQDVSSRSASSESESGTEAKDPIESGTYEIEVKDDEEAEDSITIFFSDNVRNDTTGNWRLSKVATTISTEKYAADYYKMFFSSDDEIHAVVNFTTSTTSRITYFFDNVINVSILSYVDGEEHYADKLFSGDLLEDYYVNVDTGEITDDITDFLPEE